MTNTAFTSHVEKRDLWIDKKCKTIRINPYLWTQFVDMAASKSLSTGQAFVQATKLINEDSPAEAIRRWIESEGAKARATVMCQQWLGAITEAMRPVFEARGYPLPAKIVSKLAFPSTGHKGKRRGEYWPPSTSDDGKTHHIFVHPCETDPLRIVNILTHELCHAAQQVRAVALGKPKQANNHGKLWAEVSQAMDLTEGKPAQALGGAAWEAWARPIMEGVGAMPHNSLAEAVKKEKKQVSRQLKFEHVGCPEAASDEGEGSTIWRMSAAAAGDRPFLNCRCCGERVANPLLEGEEGEIDEALEDDGDLDGTQETPHTPRKARHEAQGEPDRAVKAIGRAMKKAMAKRQPVAPVEPVEAPVPPVEAPKAKAPGRSRVEIINPGRRDTANALDDYPKPARRWTGRKA